MIQDEATEHYPHFDERIEVHGHPDLELRIMTFTSFVRWSMVDYEAGIVLWSMDVHHQPMASGMSAPRKLDSSP